MERIPCEPNPQCKFYRKDGCYQNRHHLFYPRSNYTTPLEKRFREAHVVVLCRDEHERLHHTQKPPEKPTIEEMKAIMEHIRDKGNSLRRAEEIQHVVALLGQVSALPVVERPDVSQLGYTMSQGWDSEGRYIQPSE